ncbi:caspase family protein [Treponema sp.]|uniref:caspase family protein n=1 Tax=Treponema sp. TaxID=166 RepID=UPI003F0F863B
MKKTALTVILALLAVFSTFAKPGIVVQDQHPSMVNYLKFSADGKYLLSADYTQIKIWEYKSGMLLKTIIKQDSARADFSPDGMSCVYIDENNNLMFHDLKTDKRVLLETCKEDYGISYDIKFAPNGKFFTVIDDLSNISMYDTQNLKKTLLIDTFENFYLLTYVFFPNSNLLAVSAENKKSEERTILVIDIQKKSISSIYNTKFKFVQSLDVSKNGEYIACSDSNGNAVLINNSTGRMQSIDLNLKYDDKHIELIKFSPDGKKIYAITVPYSIIQYDIKTNAKNIKKLDRYHASFAFSPKTGELVLGDFQSAKIYDSYTLKLKRNMIPDSAGYFHFFPKSKLAACQNSNEYFLFTDDLNFAGTKKYRCLSTDDFYQQYTDISDSGYFEIDEKNNLIKYRSPDNKYAEFPLQKKIENNYRIVENPSLSLFVIAEEIADGKTRLHLYDLNDREYYCYIEIDEKYLKRKISPSGNYIISRNWGCKTKVYTKPDKKNDYSYTVFSFGDFANVNFSPDEHYVAVSAEKGGDKIIYDTSDSKSWKAVRTFEHCLGDACFSNDNKYIVLDDNVNLNMFEISTGNKIRTFKTNGFDYNFCFSADDTQLYVTGNGKLQCYSVKTGELLAELYVDETGDYLVCTPDGYFTGTEGGINKFVHVVDGMEATELGQLAETFFRPDIVAAKIRGENIEKLNLSSFSDVLATGNAPAVKFDDIPSSAKTRDVTINISVEDKGGGIGSVFLKLNGKVIRLAGSERKLELVGGTSKKKKETGKNTKTFSHLVTLQNGENTIEAYATNSAGKIESRHASAKISWQGTAEKPSLYVLAVGVNKYNDIAFRLNYAVPDATSIASFFEKSGGSLYRSVNVSTVIDGEATAEGISRAFDSLKNKISADDVFVFYISGHGTTHKNDGDYYFLPVDFRWKNEESIRLNGLSKTFITENLSKIRAQKTLIMLDTCNSGAFVSAATRGIEEKMAIDRLSRATGQAIISASSNDQSAMEGFEGHGIFTYVILEGLSGKADSNRDGYISLLELSTYVEDKVPEYSFEKWGYMQNPQSDLKTANFPLIKK